MFYDDDDDVQYISLVLAVCAMCLLRCGRMDAGPTSVYDQLGGIPRVSSLAFSFKSA